MHCQLPSAARLPGLGAGPEAANLRCFAESEALPASREFRPGPQAHSPERSWAAPPRPIPQEQMAWFPRHQRGTPGRNRHPSDARRLCASPGRPRGLV